MDMQNDYCFYCGKPAEATHHLVFGRGLRELALKDKLEIRCCNECHNMATRATDRIHGNAMAMRLSKMLGQALWMLNALDTEDQIEASKEAFIERYGRNYL